MPKIKTLKKLSLNAAFLLSSSSIVTIPLFAQAHTNPSHLPYHSLHHPLSTSTNEDWSYSGATGPEFWADLHNEYAACSHGVEQSPVALHNDDASDEEKWSLDLDYKETTFSVENNGHTIQANVDEHSSNKLIVNGTDYKLEQFHFHSQSEHTLNDDYYEMEVHLVHQDEDQNLAVLGVLIEEGEKNETLANMWDVMPESEGEANETILLNPSELVPRDLSTFQYAGSLTTPPCSDHVKWSVSDTSISMSAEQLQAFQQIYPDNYRPIQELGDREVGSY
ncbi:carbonic anhydrase [Alkalicoccobacillus murimartini]|uniref:Carbonic anhydrase n=1 Tax=Alkalicoccobacillus murimartini TaxID=171685 RepID=A0ABT9YIA7_9BACI|nr:carbonic anhydrase family protein [Alkalicoccobacillus murimartini]MDQ0207225.1 carbonic anhydrase [Alkalicoccobacillus murimartini]